MAAIIRDLNRASEIRVDMALHKIKRHQVAAELGVSEMTFYRWMTGGPTDDHYRKIRSALDSLIQKEGPMPDE